MAKQSSNQPENSEAQKALEQKVDAELEIKRTLSPIAGDTPSPNAPETSGAPLISIDDMKLEPPTTEAETANPAVDQTSAQPIAADPLDDAAIDQAVDDIAAEESDVVLENEDESNKAAEPPEPVKQHRIKQLFRNKWTWLGLGIILLIVLALPMTRYPVLGLILKKPLTVVVMDSSTHTKVSNATISIRGATAKTDANGKATVRAPVGKRAIVTTKQYYQTATTTTFVGLTGHPTATVSLVATGRQVPVTVVDRISGKPLAGVDIKALDTTAKTDRRGKAIIVLPTKSANQPATLELKGFNQATARLLITDSDVPANHVALTPAGHVYFLSNLHGSIDVVRTNLDGTDRKTVLAGTGKEDAQTTSLLASRDWRYLVLEARRDTTNPGLYLIDTSNDKVTPFESAATNITLIGWYGHNFMYDIIKTSLSSWQNGREIVKSYNAENGQPYQLDQNLAEGSATSYTAQYFNNFYIVNDALVYTTAWSTYSTGTQPDLSGKNSSIRSVQPDGKNRRDYQTFAAATTSSMQAALYEPQSVYYSVYDTSGKSSFYEYQANAVKTAAIDQQQFSQSYPTYLLSPSSNHTFWTELRDGKNSLFIGDANAGNKKQIASLSDYAPYGWFSDNYLLVSKNSSELYAMPVSGLSGDQLPVKITDYYKPAQTFSGYGYGYGGL